MPSLVLKPLPVITVPSAQTPITLCKISSPADLDGWVVKLGQAAGHADPVDLPHRARVLT